MSITHEDLFALRFALQEIYIDENDIVKKLKIKCLDSGMSEEDTNTFLVDFYGKYGITFKLEEIQNINVNINTSPNSFSNTPFTNTSQLGNIFIPGSNPSNTGSNHFNSALVQFLLNTNQNSNINNNQLITQLANLENELDENENDTDSMPELEEEEEENYDSMPELEEAENYNSMPELEYDEVNDNIEVNETNQSNILLPNLSGSVSGIPNRTINISRNMYRMSNSTNNVRYRNVQNVLRNIFSTSISQLNNNGSTNMDDVVASLADDDLSNIKSYKYVKNKDDSELKCTICYDYCKEGEEVCKLNCSHEFHKDCILPYLKDYNYKCPICRKEVGKAKYNT
jgi:hypothetical protein